ncbi:TPA: hypothetical protein ACV5FI_004816 [Escherichia coli]
MGEISVKTGNNARNGGKNSLNRLIRCVCGKKIGPDPRNFNQRVSLGRNDLLIRTFLIRSLNMYIERVKKTLNVSRRVKGAYSPDEFIEKVKQYKSVQAYIAAELSGKRR